MDTIVIRKLQNISSLFSQKSPAATSMQVKDHILIVNYAVVSAVGDWSTTAVRPAAPPSGNQGNQTHVEQAIFVEIHALIDVKLKQIYNQRSVQFPGLSKQYYFTY